MEPDRHATSHSEAMSADQLAQALLMSLSSDQSLSMESGNNSRVATPSSNTTTSSMTSMSIAVPFSSHDSSLDILRDHTQPAGHPPQTTFVQEEVPGLPSAKPLAVKPVYRKRPIPIPAKSDGLIRRPGTVAAIEKDFSVGGARVARAKKGKNIYDESEINNTQTQTPEPPVQNAVMAPPPTVPEKPKKTPRPRSKRKRAPAPPLPEQYDEPDSNRKRKRIRYKKQIVWRPKTPLTPGMMNEGINRPSGLKRPTRRDHAIELLISKQEQNREKMISMTQKPLILQELQALMDARVAAEDKALLELGMMLHKELLKLQLEEGALLQMMAAVQEGRLDPSDLKRVGPGKERYGLTAVMRKPKRLIKSALNAHGDSADRGATSMDVDDESTRAQSTELGMSDADGDENDREDNEDEGEVEDDEQEEQGDEGDDMDEDDDSDEDDEEDEDDDDDDMDQEDTDRTAKMLRTAPDTFYPRLGESYASRPIISDTIAKETSKGRPANTSSKDDIKLVIDRARKRIQVEDPKDWENQDSDNEDENEEAAEVEEGEEAQNENFDEPASDEDEEDDFSEEEEEEEDDNDGGDYDDDDEARDALQRMLKEYGAPL
ncbi:hypothetical protein EMPS_06078 [Entomortierella parvispora]|uniref:Uncharacterized protein n=1 Tax=Entomortierella parvispora TaxID=205924 RepID=A0A9P3LXC8_9FUNG|nr:hypothetical protein EMPS_06078 [Entomortierella parvispora]